MKKGGFPDFEAWKLPMTYSSDMICLRFLVYPRSQVFHAGVFLDLLLGAAPGWWGVWWEGLWTGWRVAMLQCLLHDGS